jgi:hypothetical protein
MAQRHSEDFKHEVVRIALSRRFSSCAPRPQSVDEGQRKLLRQCSRRNLLQDGEGWTDLA